MHSKETKILEFNLYQKSDKAPVISYANLECIIENIDGHRNNPENPSTAKEGRHIPSGFSMSKILSFKSIQNKHGVYMGKDCTKKFCESLREQALKVINFKKKKMKLLTKKEQKSYKNAKICYTCK